MSRRSLRASFVLSWLAIMPLGAQAPPTSQGSPAPQTSAANPQSPPTHNANAIIKVERDWEAADRKSTRLNSSH